MHGIIYNAATLPQFIHFLLDIHQAPTKLIICSDRDVFLQDLVFAIRQANEIQNDVTENDEEPDFVREEAHDESTRMILSRTLSLLTLSRTIDVAFCNSVANLHAYLSVLPLRLSTSAVQIAPSNSERQSFLAIIDLISLHRETPFYSAQGFGRAFAAAIECANRTGQQLLLFENSMKQSRREDTIDHVDETLDDITQRPHDHDRHASEPASKPWDERIPILNATAKTFGNSGDRAWLGRMVKISDVAQRWCSIEPLPV